MVDWLQAAATTAVQRGEFVVVETGGWEVVPWPYALAIVMRNEHGDWTTSIEAEPAPHAPLWREPDPDQRAATMKAGTTADSLSVVGLLLAQAVASWSDSPFDLVLTFGPAPDGPWRVTAVEEGPGS